MALVVAFVLWASLSVSPTALILSHSVTVSTHLEPEQPPPSTYTSHLLQPLSFPQKSALHTQCTLREDGGLQHLGSVPVPVLDFRMDGSSTAQQHQVSSDNAALRRALSEPFPESRFGFALLGFAWWWVPGGSSRRFWLGFFLWGPVWATWLWAWLFWLWWDSAA